MWCYEKKLNILLLLHTFICIFIIHTSNAGDILPDNSIELENGKLKYISIIGGQNLSFFLNITKHPWPASHVVFQAHSQWYPLRVSNASCTTLSPAQSTDGTNIGVISLFRNLSPLLTYPQFCVMLLANEAESVRILLLATVYVNTDPIPGGCNLELPLENDPNIYLKTSNQQSHISFSYGALNGDSWYPCGHLLQHSRLVYDVYQYYLSERHLDESEYMEALKKILTVNDAAQHARMITRKSHPDKTSASFAAYTGQGAAYMVVVRVVNKTDGGPVSLPSGQAAYVPVITFSCNKTLDSCTDEPKHTNKILVLILGVIGLIICFFGHRLFVIELYVFGHLAAQFTFFILFSRFVEISALGWLFVSVGFGVAGGLGSIILWVTVASPPISLILPALEVGLLVSGIILLTTPLSIIDLLLIDYVYYLVFFTGVLFVAVVLLGIIAAVTSLHKVSILSCTVIGSYLVVMAIDWFVRGSLRQITLNVIRKLAVPGFTAAYVTIPFQWSDILLCVLWLILMVSGLVVQIRIEKNRPQFPVLPCLCCHRRRSTRPQPSFRPRHDDDEATQPLLAAEVAAPLTTTRAPGWQPAERMWQPTD